MMMLNLKGCNIEINDNVQIRDNIELNKDFLILDGDCKITGNDKYYNLNNKFGMLTNDTVEVEGRTLYRIIALKDFDDVKKGDLGGYIQFLNNLEDTDNSWIYGKEKVSGALVRINGNEKIKEKEETLDKFVIDL